MKITNQIRNNKGFSLVELMVVVAIIGILAAIAVPNVSKYMMKARQSEAKTNLAAIYSANKALFVEYNGYTTRFTVMGYAPEGQLRYNVGFQADVDPINAASLGNAYTGQRGLPVDARSNGFCPLLYAPANRCTCLVECSTNTALPGTTTVTAGAPPLGPTFLAGAAGNLKKNALASDTDIWTINQLKVVTQVQDGAD